MGIRHSATKAPDEKGYATEWNDDHVINSDINFAGHSGTNVGEPINASDIATKNYVDGTGGIYLPGAGIDIVGNVISAETAATNNAGIALFNSTDFLVGTGGVVSLKSKSSYWSAPGMAFLPASDEIMYDRQVQGVMSPYSSLSEWYLPVHLPHGAIITRAAVFGDDTGRTWYLRRKRIADWTGAVTIAYANFGSTDTSIAYATVDNANYSYYFLIYNLDSSDYIYGARIRYTTDYD